MNLKQRIDKLERLAAQKEPVTIIVRWGDEETPAGDNVIVLKWEDEAVHAETTDCTD